MDVFFRSITHHSRCRIIERHTVLIWILILILRTFALANSATHCHTNPANRRSGAPASPWQSHTRTMNGRRGAPTFSLVSNYSCRTFCCRDILRMLGISCSRDKSHPILCTFTLSGPYISPIVPIDIIRTYGKHGLLSRPR